MIANAPLRSVGFSAEPGVTPLVRGGLLVSGNYFRVLDVEPRIGRGFRDDEDAVPGRDAVAVLAPDFWRREFKNDASVVGRTILLNGVEFTVIGVAPEAFPGMYLFARPDFYIPLAMARVFSTNPKKDFFVDRDDRELTVSARLKGTIACARRKTSSSGAGAEPRARPSEAESGPRRRRPDHAPDANPGQRPRLEVRA